MEINEQKRNKFMEYAGKRVNNVMHDMQILEPMARSSAYDFTKEDVEEMFNAMQETLNDVKAEFNKRFEEKARTEKKVFSFGTSTLGSATKINSEINNDGKNNLEGLEQNLNEDSIENNMESNIESTEEVIF